MTEKKKPTIADVLQAITGMQRDVSGLQQEVSGLLKRGAEMKQSLPGLEQAASSLREELERFRRDMIAAFDRLDAITNAIRDDLARRGSKGATGR
jgi:chromosome segregation ATPase